MDTQVIAGRYRLERRLGAGAMSEVWARSGSRARSHRRGQAARARGRPGPLRARGPCGSRALAPEHLRPLRLRRGRRPAVHGARVPAGGTLEERLAPGRPLPDAEAERIAWEIAAGLAHAHDRGLVHRDLKPSNVLFDAEGRAKIADFGIARIAAERVDRGRDGARHRRLHLARAGGRRAGDSGERRLRVRRDPLPDAHRPAAVRGAGRPHGRCDAPRPAAAAGHRAPRRRTAPAGEPGHGVAGEEARGPARRRTGVLPSSASSARRTRPPSRL